jgi:type IV pilus assembly protein PilW
MNAKISRQYGVTLIELMVAMTLGVIVLGSAIQMFSANKQSYRLSTALARVQEDGRFAMASMARDIRMAGYVGCDSRQQITVNTVATGTPPSVDLGTNAVFGYDNGTGWWSGVTPPKDHLGRDLTICDAVGGGTATCQTSDIVQLIRGSETGVALSTDMASAADTIRVRTADFSSIEPGITVGGNAPANEDLVLVTDCRRADLFRTTASAVVGTERALTPNAVLQQAYRAGSIVTPLVSANYFIADDNVDENGDGTPDPIPALYRIGTTDGGVAPAALPIAKGVEMMRVTYGIDTGGDEFADTYTNSAGVTDWSRVVSARISLLLKSKDDFVTDSPVPVTFVDGTVVNAGAGADRRLRLVFSTTVTLRNRIP